MPLVRPVVPDVVAGAIVDRDPSITMRRCVCRLCGFAVPHSDYVLSLGVTTSRHRIVPNGRADGCCCGRVTSCGRRIGKSAVQMFGLIVVVGVMMEIVVLTNVCGKCCGTRLRPVC